MKRMFRRLLPAAILFLLTAAVQAAPSPLAKQMADVERIRGLRFKHDVTVKTIERSDIPERLRAEMRRSMPYSVDDYIGVLRSLQLVDGNSHDLTDKMLALYESQVLAYYDPSTHTYFAVRQLPDSAKSLGNSDVLVQSVAIHELTHALQDQYFDIGRKDDALHDDWDGQLAYHSLIEGEASLVMMAWMVDKAGRSLDDVVKSDLLTNALASGAAAEKSIDPTMPRYFVESLKFPYLDGLRFVIEAYRRGGWKELDRIHAHPPRTTREVLHPEEYFARTFAVRAFDGHEPPNVLTVEHLGEFHWAFLVGAEKARGWVDDRVTVTCDEQVVAETTWDSPARATAFRDAYLAFLHDRGIEARDAVDGSHVRVTYGVQQ
jgi:hypothetical protein